ncbi:MAG: hypothetical protein J7M24_03140 [Candidatus Latescibacteria bacterium]|nr:hypothetical protein [Candidatus Latescibacterota bacterium]
MMIKTNEIAVFSRDERRRVRIHAPLALSDSVGRPAGAALQLIILLHGLIILLLVSAG